MKYLLLYPLFILFLILIFGMQKVQLGLIWAIIVLCPFSVLGIMGLFAVGGAMSGGGSSRATPLQNDNNSNSGN